MPNPTEYPTPHTANPGDTLQNGAVLVAKFFDLRGRCFIAAKYGSEHVSWYFDRNGHCHSGHYFFSGTDSEQAAKATESAKKRAKA